MTRYLPTIELRDGSEAVLVEDLREMSETPEATIFCGICGWASDIGAEAHAQVIHGDKAVVLPQMGRTFILATPTPATELREALEWAYDAADTYLRRDDLNPIERQRVEGHREAARAALTHYLAPDTLDAAWAEAEAALPEGWRLHGVSRPGDAEKYWASAHGPVVKGRCDMGREHEDYPRENGYGETPTEALTDLAARLRSRE